MEAPPIFIVGVARSGTTLLRLMLDCHPNIASGPESRMLLAFARMSKRHGATFEAYGFDRRYWLDRIGEFYGRFLSDYAESKGKGRWCEKTPDYGLHLDFLKDLYPDAQIIHVIRDGRSVVLSHLRRWGLRNAIRTTGKWRELIESAREFGRLWPDHYHELRYEDLVRDPEGELRRLLDFLGEAWDPAVLEPYAVSHDQKKTRHGKRPKVSGRERAAREGSRGIHTQSLSSGGKLNPLLKWLLYRRAGALLRELDYL